MQRAAFSGLFGASESRGSRSSRARRVMPGGGQRLDPRSILAALARRYVAYVLIGGLAQVLRGVDRVTTGAYVCPSLAKDNLDRLALALGDLDARGSDGEPRRVQRPRGCRDLDDWWRGEAGAAPAGVPNGYVDLRRGASKENLGHGLSPLIACMGDLAGVAAALGREQDLMRLAELRRIVELEVNRDQALWPPVASPVTPRRLVAKRGPPAGPLTQRLSHWLRPSPERRSAGRGRGVSCRGMERDRIVSRFRSLEEFDEHVNANCADAYDEVMRDLNFEPMSGKQVLALAREIEQRTGEQLILGRGEPRRSA